MSDRTPSPPHIQRTIALSDSTSPNLARETHPPQSGTKDDAIDLSAVLAPPQDERELGRLGQYRVLKVLGRGGMGMVLLAEDTQLLRMAAVKIMLPAFATDLPSRERFLREARAAARIKHDHVVTIFQVGEERGLPFIAMEFLKGSSLDDYLEGRSEMVSGQALRVGQQIAEGLRAAHAEGLIHRDIKPANIWLEAPKGRVKILDFGLARELNDDLKLTQTGALIGTPLYMSPEQALGEPLDPRSDLFSLGVVLYRLCTGRLPFVGKNMMMVIAALSVETPPPVCEVNPKVPVDFGRLIDRLLAKKPDDRPQSADEVVRTMSAIKKAARGGIPEAVGEEVQEAILVDSITAIEDGYHDTAILIADPGAVTTVQRPPGAQTMQVPPRGGHRWLLLLLVVAGLGVGGFFAVREFNSRPGAPPKVIIVMDDGGKAEPKKKEKEREPTPIEKDKKNTPVIEPKKKDPDNKVVIVPKPAEPALLKAPFTKDQALKSRSEWARHLKIDESRELDLGKGVKLKLVLIPPGTFTMGSSPEERPKMKMAIPNEDVREVTISRPFYLAISETTQQQYESVMGVNPSFFSAQGVSKDLVAGRKTTLFPVEGVSWNDALEFGHKLNAQLPTEAQWEYACRAGTTSAFYFGDSLDGSGANSSGEQPAEVGGAQAKKERSQPNSFGLYDMHGNVREWCRDFYEARTSDLADVDPLRQIGKGAERRVIRGGGFYQLPAQSRSSSRAFATSMQKFGDTGFRVVVTP